eukprot:193456-Amphidinium_carterae.1
MAYEAGVAKSSKLLALLQCICAPLFYALPISEMWITYEAGADAMCQPASFQLITHKSSPSLCKGQSPLAGVATEVATVSTMKSS